MRSGTRDRHEIKVIKNRSAQASRALLYKKIDELIPRLAI